MATYSVLVICLFSVSATAGLRHDATLFAMPRARYQFKRSELHRTNFSNNCGDNNCWCYGDTASCFGGSLGVTYIPKLPVTISVLTVFLSVNLDPDRTAEHFFTNASHVIDLTLVGGNFIHIPHDTFGVIHNLTTLAIYSEPISDVNSIWYLLSIPTLRELGVSLGHLPPGALNKVDSFVTGLSLSFEYNSRFNFNLTQFVPLQHLQTLNLDLNGVNEVTCETLIGLKLLSLEHNNLVEFPVTCDMFEKSLYPNLEKLILGHNFISDLNTQVCLPKLKHLDLSYNLLTIIDGGIFGDENCASLSYLDVSHQRDLISVGDFAFNNSKLTTLSLAENRLDFGDSFGVNVLAFANCQNLSVLILDRNNFEEVNNERFQTMLGHLPLVTLSLIDCDLNVIYENMLGQFYGLQELYLGDNKIDTIPDGIFDSNTNLRVLDVSENKLSVVTETTFSKNIQKHLVQLSLANNPFVCSCDLLWFRNWLAMNQSLFYQDNRIQLPPHYKCNNIPEMNVDNFTMVHQACLLTRETSIQISVALSLIILTFTLFSLLFRHRWHIRLILYEGFRGPGDVRRLRLQTNSFDYDVFVSYAAENKRWVHQYLMSELEDRLGLRLCVHERDFIPGKNIVDNIADCVESSKKILMVFSRDFVRSPWCQFELNYCLTHAMDHDDVLIIVCVDNVASRQTTTAMMAVLKTTTYIQWAELDDAIQSFWGRLHLALTEIIEPVYP